jgi:hypothetical protein
MKIILPVYFQTEETESLKDLGLPEPDVSDYDVRDGVFYNIDAIVPYVDAQDVVRTEVFAGSHNFICPMSPKEVEALIDEAMSPYRKV